MLSYWNEKPLIVPKEKSISIASCIVVACVLIFGLLFGIIVGHHLFYVSCYTVKIDTDTNHSLLISEMLKAVSVQRISNDFLAISQSAHIAGSNRDNEIVDNIYDEWNEYMDSVERIPYKVLLSYPNVNLTNTFHIVEFSTRRSILRTNDLLFFTSETRNISSFYAYSPPGNVTARIAYANFGQVSDFAVLEMNFSIHMLDMICMLRVGKIGLALKVKNAAKAGCLAVVIFAEPAAKIDPSFSDPEELTPSAVKSGTVKQDLGDPLTPLTPSIDGVHRIHWSDADLPAIPCQPISYQDAMEIFELMTGPNAPSDWTGGPSATYKLGPEFKNPNHLAVLKVNNKFENVIVYNVIGRFYGNIEPDRFVLHGSHRDSLAFGAASPGTAHSQMMETARVTGMLIKNGWRPRRTIAFASWAATEFGVIGAQEWVEENLPLVQSGCVSYLNSAPCAGSHLTIAASPSLLQLAYSATRHVPDPRRKETSVYRAWLAQSKVDKLQSLSTGAGTNIAPFEMFLGIPVIDVGFISNNVSKSNASTPYPLHGTLLDNVDLVTNVLDPGYKYQCACTQINTVLIIWLADSALLPLNLQQLSKIMRYSMQALIRHFQGDLEEAGVSLKYLSDAVYNFEVASNSWMQRVDKAYKEVKSGGVQPCWRCLNDQANGVHRALVTSHGIYGRKFARNILLTPSDLLLDEDEDGLKYGVEGFGGIAHGIRRFKAESNFNQRDLLIEELKEHVSECFVLVHQATKMLAPFK